MIFFFSSRRRHTRLQGDWSSDVCSSDLMSVANWDDAVKHLETAVRIAPRHIYHRLELAEVYTDLGRYSKAREQLIVIATLPEVDVLDGQYKKDAAALLAD